MHLNLKSFEHPQSQGGKISKRLGGIIGCKDKTSSRDSIKRVMLIVVLIRTGMHACMVMTLSRVWINRVRFPILLLIVVS